MKISMHAMSAELFANSLSNLAHVLEKGVASATARKIDPAVLLAARLAPDMLPLTRQVQIACDISKSCVARLAGQEPRRFEDNEKSFEELGTRIAHTIDYIKSFPASAFEASEQRDIKLPAGGERTLELKGLDYLRHWAIPNVLFHITTAYDILRHNGVELGKRDFIAGGKTS
jgi:hypothetical protein